jgi:hypothetical protein
MRVQKFPAYFETSFILLMAQFCDMIVGRGSRTRCKTLKFPKGIIRIHYENLAFYPINMTIQIYKYLNLSFSLHIEKSVLNMTSSGKKETGILNRKFSPMFFDPGICIYRKLSPMFYDLGIS